MSEFNEKNLDYPQSSKNKIINLPPPELTTIDPKFAKYLKKESIVKQQEETFTRQYFENILSHIAQSQTEIDPKNIGIRAVLIATEANITTNVNPLSGKQATIATIDEILNNGGERSESNTTLITTPGIPLTDTDLFEEEMTKRYLLTALKTALNSQHPEKLQPAILVYDLSQASRESGSFEVKFPNTQVRKNSLKAIYPLDTHALQK